MKSFFSVHVKFNNIQQQYHRFFKGSNLTLASQVLKVTCILLSYTSFILNINSIRQPYTHLRLHTWLTILTILLGDTHSLRGDATL